MQCKLEWQPNTHLTFFSFPMKNEAVANQWRKVVPCNVKLGKSTVVCSNHFNESDFIYIGPRRCLKKDVVPSIFPVDPHLVPQNGKDTFGPGRLHDVNQIQNDMEIKEDVDTQDNSDADTSLVLIDHTNYNISKKTDINEQKMVSKKVHEKKLSAMNRRIRILRARRKAKFRKVTTLLKLLKRRGKSTDDLSMFLC